MSDDDEHPEEQAVKPLRFREGDWRPSTDGAVSDDASGRVDRLRIVTWNIWFAPYEQHRRTLALLEALEQFKPNVIALQEVVPETLAVIAESPWVRRRFELTDATGETLSDYGVVLLSRFPISTCALHRLPTSHGRRLLVATLDVDGAPFSVATTHLESLEFNSARRQEQLEVTFERLRALPEDVVLMGDMNFDDGDEEETVLDPTFEDLAKRGTQAKVRPPLTVDTYRNTMRRRLHGKSKRARYDRIFLRSPNARWKVESTILLGTAPIPAQGRLSDDEVFVSDHFGVGATLARG
ncbi:MAG: endonuclease/exonuclease/phosphatase family protein [Polyangiaceae bacterium]